MFSYSSQIFVIFWNQFANVWFFHEILIIFDLLHFSDKCCFMILKWILILLNFFNANIKFISVFILIFALFHSSRFRFYLFFLVQINAHHCTILIVFQCYQFNFAFPICSFIVCLSRLTDSNFFFVNKKYVWDIVFLNIHHRRCLNAIHIFIL